MFSKALSFSLLAAIVAQVAAQAPVPTPLAKRLVAPRQAAPAGLPAGLPALPVPPIDIPDVLGDIEDNLSQTDAYQSLASEEVVEQVSFIDGLFPGIFSLDQSQVSAASVEIYSVYSQGAQILSASADPNFSSIAANFSSAYVSGVSELYTSAAASVFQSLAGANRTASLSATGSASIATSPPSPSASGSTTDSDGASNLIPSAFATLLVGSVVMAVFAVI